MKITNTANSTLGRYLTFDASYISRIRSGKRRIPQNQPFSEPVSEFFADRITDDYQKKIVGDLICPGKDWPENSHTAAKVLFQWLSLPDSADSAPVGGLLSGLSLAQDQNLPPMHPEKNESTELSQDVSFFYGNEGKRQAVLMFLSDLATTDNPPQLLLYSNEEFSWLYEDAAFAKKWALLLMSYIRKGGRIKIAHTISRASGDMLVALQKWIPLYMTGAIEPYYYPKILDRVFRKTMFIAEGHSAITASSVGQHTETGLNCLIRDTDAVAALEKEYWNFFELCRPLMQIFNLTSREKFFDVLGKFNRQTENLISVRTTPSFFTMPDSVAQSMNKRLDSSWILKRQQEGSRTFARMMEQGNTLTEILNLPDAEEIRQGTTPFPMCDLFEKSGLFYTAEEFAAHLDSVIEKLKNNPGYQVILSSAIPANEIVFVKEDTGVILVKSDFPSIAFAISEQRMVSAFWDYLEAIRENANRKPEMIQQLETLRDQLR